MKLAPPPSPRELLRPSGTVDSGRLDVSRFAVIGGGLAAGASGFGTSATGQRWSFPAQLAHRMGTRLRQPLIQPPGIGNPPGLAELPVRLPALAQTTVVEEGVSAPLPGNLSIPGFRLADAAGLRAEMPLVRQEDSRQSAANLILAMPCLAQGEEETELPTQLEAAVSQRPTLTLVALGYQDLLEAALETGPEALASAGEVDQAVRFILQALTEAGSQIVVATIPDPFDTPACTSREEAARTLRTTPELLGQLFGVEAEDRLTCAGLHDLAYRLLGGASSIRPQRWLIPAEQADQLRCRLEEINGVIRRLAQDNGALVFDLHDLWRRVRRQGIRCAGRTLTADYFGGFYDLGGYYPGATGHSVIANDLLGLLNTQFGAQFEAIDLARVAEQDPVADYASASGEIWRQSPAASAVAMQPPMRPPMQPSPVSLAPAAGEVVTSSPDWQFELPPGLVQELPLAREASYYGDAIRVVDCTDPRDRQWGSCAGVLFGGLALFDSHLEGRLRLRFSPPNNDVTRFEVSIVEGARGEDSVLAAPWLFRWPVHGGRVEDGPGVVSSGKLNLVTGEVSNLDLRVRFLNSALFALLRVNPNFPTQPIAFPGAYGSASGRFEQREDGLLDFTFTGTTFIPLGAELGGDPVRWALPFTGPEQRFASIPARGLALHPHLHLSTREEATSSQKRAAPTLPTNTVHQYTLFSHNSAFGDVFGLEIPELGGPATGRSHVAGRLQIQFGEPFGRSQSIAISSLPPGGLMIAREPLPLDADFPGRLAPGLLGHNELLRFPLRSYYLDAVELIDDPFDLAVGAIDLDTGEVRHGLLHRGLIGQNLFYALLRVEPRTPRSSFFFHGPASLEGSQDYSVYRFRGEVMVPYPEGFAFPAPDLASGYAAGPNSRLDPYFWLRAIRDQQPSGEGLQSEGREVRASTGEIFTYRLSIPGNKGGGYFDYTNHSRGGTFRMSHLLWRCLQRSSADGGDAGRADTMSADTVSFTAVGRWSLDDSGQLHTAAVHLSTNPRAPYVSILIDGGAVSNVNTKPAREEDALP